MSMVKIKKAKSHHVHHRFKVQRRVAVTARDRSNQRFLLAEHWRTVAEADHQPAAEAILRGVRMDNRRAQFRVAEVWPEGANERVIIGPKENAARPG